MGGSDAHERPFGPHLIFAQQALVNRRKAGSRNAVLEATEQRRRQPLTARFRLAVSMTCRRSTSSPAMKDSASVGAGLDEQFG